MPKIRYGDFVSEGNIQHIEVDYALLQPQKKTTDQQQTQKVKLRPKDFYRLLKPYIGIRFIYQFKAVVPLSIYLMLFQILILRQDVADTWVITAGLSSIIIGLMLFMEGLKLGLMPFGESIGHSLPVKSPLSIVLLITFLLGISVTFAEPAIGALKSAGSFIKPTDSPLLFLLLNDFTNYLVLVVGLGVGFAAVLGTLRFIFGWSLKPFIYGSLLPTLALTAYAGISDGLQDVIGLAWDCGAVTTGPVTVPLVLSLGIGVAASAGKGENSLAGFGIVTLASVFPIMGVLLLSLGIHFSYSPEQLLQMADNFSKISDQQLQIPWHSQTPWLEIFAGMQSILPLVLFLLFILKIILKEKLKNKGFIIYGIFLAVLGMIIINLGLAYGLAKLGAQAGGFIPGAFAKIEPIQSSPLYAYSLGLLVAILFAWFLGFGATMAEPALNTLGDTVENLTNGAFKKFILMYSVSFGVALGLALGVSMMIFQWSLEWILIPTYAFALLLTFLSTEEFVNVAWDSAGVTTGPVTVPLVLSMGLGFGSSLELKNGFGILAMASICPILSVLTCGIIIKMNQSRRKRKAEKSILQKV